MADYDINDVLGIGTSKPKAEPKKDKPQVQKDPAKASTKGATKKSPNKITADTFIIPKKETKSKRLQVLMKPSMYDKLKETADANCTTVNDLVNVMFETFLK